MCIEPPLPLQTPLAFHQLGYHAVDSDALRDAVAVPAVRGGDVVAVGELGADTHRHCLLAGVQVNEAGDEAGSEVLAGKVLECANLDHALVHVEELVST
jgi:hypothetical protein